MRNLCGELEKRFLVEGVKGKLLIVKIMRWLLDVFLDLVKYFGYGKCDIFNKSVSFGVVMCDVEVIGKEVVGILWFYKFSFGDLRGIGV